MSTWQLALVAVGAWFAAAFLLALAWIAVFGKRRDDG